MSKGTGLARKMTKGEIAIANFMMWLTNGDENDAQAVQLVIDTIKLYRSEKNA